MLSNLETHNMHILYIGGCDIIHLLIFKLEEGETRHRLGIWTKSMFAHQLPYPRDIMVGQKKTNSLPLPLHVT